MSMPMLVNDYESTRPAAPALRLADDLDGDAADLDDDAASAGPMARVVGGRLIVENAARLPAACVACGDTVGLVGLATPRGRVGFSLCREHLISAIARAAVGLAVMVVAAFLIVRGGGGMASKLLISAGLSGVGALLVASAVPVWTWRDKYGTRRLFHVHRDVVGRVERASR